MNGTPFTQQHLDVTAGGDGAGLAHWLAIVNSVADVECQFQVAFDR